MDLCKSNLKYGLFRHAIEGGSRRVPEPSLTRKQAAEFLTQLGFSCSQQTLANYAANNNARKGPAFLRIGWKAVRYRPEDLQAWFNRMAERVE